MNIVYRKMNIAFFSTSLMLGVVGLSFDQASIVEAKNIHKMKKNNGSHRCHRHVHMRKEKINGCLEHNDHCHCGHREHKSDADDTINGQKQGFEIEKQTTDTYAHNQINVEADTDTDVEANVEQESKKTQRNSIEQLTSLDSERVIASSDENKTSETAETIERVITIGEKYLGVDYKWGSPSGTTTTFDCSSFIQHIFKEGANILLRRSSSQQGEDLKRYGGVKKDWKQLERGDLMFFSGSSFTNTDEITHVGIYLGNDEMMHTYKEGIGVVKNKMSQTSWEKRFLFGGKAVSN